VKCAPHLAADTHRTRAAPVPDAFRLALPYWPPATTIVVPGPANASARATVQGAARTQDPVDEPAGAT
jgi:hypothetical protein